MSEFRTDGQDPLAVGLGRGDLQQHNELTIGHAVVPDRQVTQFQQFFQTDAGQSEHLDDRPAPESVVLKRATVDGFRVGGIEANDLDGRERIIDVRAGRDGFASICLSERLELASWRCDLGEGQKFGGVDQIPVCARNKFGQERHESTGPGVHPCPMPKLESLERAQVAIADRRACYPRGPHVWAFRGPAGDVEVERSDDHQDRVDIVASLAVGQGPETFLPGSCDRWRKLDGLGARMVTFDVGPEVADQLGGDVAQRGIVDTGLAFLQVSDEQVANGLAAHLVSVDHLLDGVAVAASNPVTAQQRGIVDTPHAPQQLMRDLQASDLDVAAAARVRVLQQVNSGDLVHLFAGVDQDSGQQSDPDLTHPSRYSAGAGDGGQSFEVGAVGRGTQLVLEAGLVIDLQQPLVSGPDDRVAHDRSNRTIQGRPLIAVAGTERDHPVLDGVNISRIPPFLPIPPRQRSQMIQEHPQAEQASVERRLSQRHLLDVLPNEIFEVIA